MLTVAACVMMTSNLIFLAFCALCVQSLCKHVHGHNSRIMEAFRDEEVVPDVIDRVPEALLTLTYGDTEIEPGMEQTPTQVRDPPCVKYDAEDGAYYTLIMNDPDAPSRKDPKYREWHHWLVTNILGSDVDSGDVMSQYVGAGPPPQTGFHRYVFLLFKQRHGKQEFPGLQKLTNRSTDNRAKQSVRKFAEKYNLGEPVAGNFFQAKYDEYVDELYRQLKGE